ncbi:MAG: M23 family metallopeptidase [Spirochaetaceae bacterium]|nr:M23 family metallopeptidase [Spirochaetaceae bacterium]
MLRGLLLLSICLWAVGCAHGQERYYVMQRGDTLYSASREVGIPVQELMAANDITDARRVPAGTRLRVPGGDAVSQAAVPTMPVTYAMVRGDTLYSIANRFDLDVRELMRLNDIDDPRDLATGTVLTLQGVSDGDPGLEEPVLWPTEGERQRLTGKLRGVAIHGARGQAVRSVSSGTVTWSGPSRGYGYVVLVRRDSYVYAYLNNEQVLVQVGDRVQVGSEIGTLGVAPHDNTPQLYFVVTKDSRFVDPVSAPRA